MSQNSLPSHIQLAIMSREYVVSRAIHTVARLDVAEYMSDKPINIIKLAELTKTIPEFLDRLLDFLSNYDLFIKTNQGYALQELAYPLKKDHPFSLKKVLTMFDETWWQTFAHLETTIKTGEAGFHLQQGQNFFDYLDNHPDKKSHYENGIATLSTFDDKTIADSFNFGQFEHLVDIGEARDHFVKMLKIKYPYLNTSLFNLRSHINQNDIFSSLPNAQAYLFKGILHDYNDEIIKIILKNCYKNIPSNSSLLIAEQAILENDLPHVNKTMDIIMMALVGGRQRTCSNWISLIECCGFKLKNTYPTSGIYTIMDFSLI